MHIFKLSLRLVSYIYSIFYDQSLGGIDMMYKKTKPVWEDLREQVEEIEKISLRMEKGINKILQEPILNDINKCGLVKFIMADFKDGETVLDVPKSKRKSSNALCLLAAGNANLHGKLCGFLDARLNKEIQGYRTKLVLEDLRTELNKIQHPEAQVSCTIL